MRQGRCIVFICSMGLLLVAGQGHAQAPLLSYDFSTDDLSDFLNPNGVQAIDLCGEVIPGGEATVESGELVITNDAFLGLTLFAFDPLRVEELFPAGNRNYTVGLYLNLESVNELSLYVRARLGFLEGSGLVDSQRERGYVVSIAPQGVEGVPDGFMALAEFTGCHTVVPHPEWPGAVPDGYVVTLPSEPIVAGDYYYLEVTAQGNDDGGPVLITARLKTGPDDAPLATISVTDPNGLAHTPATLDPETDAEIAFGTSFDFDQQPGAVCRLDDLTVTFLEGCDEAPLTATRSLWPEKTLAEGREVALYADGAQYSVSIDLSGVRGAGFCAPATAAKIVETAPAGWTLSDASSGGVIAGNVITWNLTLPADAAAPLTYKATASGGGLVTFTGEISESGSTLTFLVGGEAAAVNDDALPQVSDFGTIQRWLILGPFTRQVGGANPGEAEIRRDYLADGDLTEVDIQPRAGDEIVPDYGGLAASTGLAPNLLDRNPGDIPTWIEWRDYDDADDRIDFETVYGDINEVMCYAVTYLDVEDDVVVNFGISSDDSVQVLLDGEQIHINNVPRGALGRSFQDTPFTHSGLGNISLVTGQHTLMVKVFEGGGEHNFRVGFLDESGIEIPGGPPEITVSLEPSEVVHAVVFRRGDSDSNGKLELTDAVKILSYLFSGGTAPECFDAADADDNGDLQLTDAVRILGYLFLGGPPPAAPGPTNCGPDPTTTDTLPCASYTPPAGFACQ